MIKKSTLTLPDHLNKDRGTALNPSDLLNDLPPLSGEAAWGLVELLNQLAYVVENHYQDQINCHLYGVALDPEPPDNDWFDEGPPF